MTTFRSKPEWWHTLTPEELPFFEALHKLVEQGEASWD